MASKFIDTKWGSSGSILTSVKASWPTELSDLMDTAPCSIPRSDRSDIGDLGFLLITLGLTSSSGDVELSLPPISILMFGKDDLEMPSDGY